jgi:predicted metalloprotease with PDZ domain
VTLVFAASLAAAQASTAAPLEIGYHLILKRPTTHILRVEITVQNVSTPSIEFVLPRWAPGRYAIYDFAKNVQQFRALGARNQPLRWRQPDDTSWQVDTGGAQGTVQVHYRVYANDLTGSFSQFDTTHAAVNGASVFMYVAGHKPDPVTLTVDPPADWKIVSGFSLSTRQQTFHAPNYDILVDTPLEISPHLLMDEFQDRGKTFRVAVHSFDPGDTDIQPLVDGVKKIVDTEMGMMPSPDFSNYTFLFHFAPDIPLGDGMEHLNSTDIIIAGSLSQGALEQALETAAHEFFHVWNVKRLRPVGLGPFDYRRPVYIHSLWFVEGITTYYSYLALLRCGLWNRRQFLHRLGREIRHLRRDPGRRLMSAESSSFHAWFYDRAPQMQETNFANSTISYYNKGAILGMLLDLEIRARTGGEKTLADVMRWMYQKYYESPAATYYGPGRGYREKDILDAVNQVSGGDFSDFFACYVAGTAPLPYGQALADAGLKLETSVAPGTPPSLGASTVPVDTGVKIVTLRPGGAADRAGLSRDDILIDLDNQSLAINSLKGMLGIYPPGAKVPFTVQRHLERRMIWVTLDAPEPNVYRLEDLPNATPQAITIRRQWLR